MLIRCQGGEKGCAAHDLPGASTVCFDLAVMPTTAIRLDAHTRITAVIPPEATNAVTVLRQGWVEVACDPNRSSMSLRNARINEGARKTAMTTAAKSASVMGQTNKNMVW